jgi:hypothetical protein
MDGIAYFGFVDPAGGSGGDAMVTRLCWIGEVRTVVLAGMTEELVASRTVMPATIHDGVEAKCWVALPEAVVALVVAAPASVAARQGREQGNLAGRQRGHSHLTGEVVQNVLRSVVRLAGHVDSYAMAQNLLVGSPLATKHR